MSITDKLFIMYKFNNLSIDIIFCNSYANYKKNILRINVAISRAKMRCIIVGNVTVLRSDPTWKRIIDKIKKEGGFSGDIQQTPQVSQPLLGTVPKTARRVSNSKPKKEICRHFVFTRPNGSSGCQWGSACNFLHPRGCQGVLKQGRGTFKVAPCT